MDQQWKGGATPMTMSFAELLKSDLHLSPSQQQQLASELFPSVVENSHMQLWRPGEGLPSGGTEIWIGVASYSIPDLEMLDDIEAKLSRQNAEDETIHLFDVSAFPEFRNFEDLLPGIGKVFQTPVIGIWEGGVLKERASGARAMDWLAQRYRLST